MKKIISPNAPKALGHYSHAIRSGQLLFLSGQLPLDPDTNKILGIDIEAQATQALKNIQNVLQDAGLGLSNVIKVNIYLADIADFQKLNQLYEQAFEDHKPARTTKSAKGLPLNALVKIECVAEFDD